MANYIHIQIRRDTSANWESINPVLLLGELGADMTLHRLKVGDGVTAWKNLAWTDSDVVNDLLTGGSNNALSAEQGKVLKSQLAGEADNTAITALQTEIRTIRQEISNLNITKLELTINNIRQQIATISNGDNIFGMGYTVDSFNGYGKPTKVTFSDGLSATLTWSGTRLERIVSSTGKVMTMSYNADGLITGRTVTQGS